VDAILRRPALLAAALEHGRAPVVDAVRHAIAARLSDPAAIETGVLAEVAAKAQPSLRRVFNLTGTVLHTNLGRAPLPPEALAAIVEAADACNLEYDLASGERGERDDHVEQTLCRLTGAEAALVVNNNAAAVLLALNTLAEGREVIVSRGELIEIGGAFRIPDIITRSQCILREVGTTNRTHKRDYADAIGHNTAAILKVHKANYVIEGFTAEVAERDLAAIAHAKNLPLVVDLGSGSLIDLAKYNLPHEPTPMETIAAGADLVTFSGDKLLGGPQAGLIVGRVELIAKLRRNPLKRALRVDKFTLAALAAVLCLYADPDRLAQRLPTLRRLVRTAVDIQSACERICPALQTGLGDGVAVTTEPQSSQIGSGSRPMDLLPSHAIALRPGTDAALVALARAFRALPIPVIGRLHDGALLFDLRCLEDEKTFLAQLVHLPASATL
jgi:L-seryl-tRNA(Ser) seleniumtransferase